MTPPGTKSAELLPAALLTIAVLLRAGVVPVHCWMTDLFEHASFGTALLFVAPMTGAYAVMHLVLPFGPDVGHAKYCRAVTHDCRLCCRDGHHQKDARRFFCYLFLSHASLVLSGLEIVSTIGLTGGVVRLDFGRYFARADLD